MRSDSVENAILQMQDNLKHLLSQHKNENWFQNGNIKIAEILSGDKEISAFGKELILFLAEYLGCHGGTFYRANKLKSSKPRMGTETPFVSICFIYFC